MKTLVITSAVTFVPDNYDDLTLGLADNPYVQGLVVIDNRSADIYLKAFLLMLSGAGPLMGWHLLKNSLDNSLARKQKRYESLGKKVWVVKDINSEETIKFLSSLEPDVILNARTRSFFKKRLLSIPKIGCINIHHGLLPHQRGLMCDFWAHLFGTSFGFSIHEMTSKLDDGSLLKVVEVSSDKKNYLQSLKNAAQLETAAATEVLHEIARTQKIQGIENSKTDQTVYRSNPGLIDFYKLRLRGIKI